MGSSTLSLCQLSRQFPDVFSRLPDSLLLDEVGHCKDHPGSYEGVYSSHGKEETQGEEPNDDGEDEHSPARDIVLGYH